MFRAASRAAAGRGSERSRRGKPLRARSRGGRLFGRLTPPPRAALKPDEIGLRARHWPAAGPNPAFSCFLAKLAFMTGRCPRFCPSPFLSDFWKMKLVPGGPVPGFTQFLEDEIGARRACPRFYLGSRTVTMRSASTFSKICVLPEGQRISTRSAFAWGPRPKRTGPRLEEA